MGSNPESPSLEVALQLLTRQISKIPEGTAALFFIQTFSTLGFAVLQSSLVLYTTQHLHFSTRAAASIMGVFGAFNYGLHLFGGYLGGRFLSNRNLFVGGMALQVFGCACIATGTVDLLYWGLALFLTGSGLNVTCINMMLTQRFAPSDIRREGAFFWNYAGMNVGFFVGFTVAGHYQLTRDYTSLFIFATVGNVMAIVLAAFNWRAVADRSTPLIGASPERFRMRFVAGIFVLFGLVPIVWILLLRPDSTETIVKAMCALVAAALVVTTIRHPDPVERRNMWAYLILGVGSLVFWSLYQMAPNGLTIFSVYNVDRHVAGFEIAPQWILNINTVVIVLGGPLMSVLFTRLRARGWNIDVPLQFAIAVLLMGFGFLVLPAGIALADQRGMSAFGWLFLSYVLQSIGELLISPVGYAMVGRLAPQKYQGIMMGSWMLVTGLASLFAGDFSGMAPDAEGKNALETNAAYASLFSYLGFGSTAVGIAMVGLIPILRKLIRDREELPKEASLASIPLPHT
jgi:POT family proton-dependent oligopeptide transporter